MKIVFFVKLQQERFHLQHCMRMMTLESFWTLSQLRKDIALILPKEHYANLYELDDEIAAKVLVLAKKIVTKLSDILGCEGYNIVQNNGAAAGQSVFHYHMHLIPRYKDDTVDIKWKLGTLTEEDKEYILKKMNEK